ncbi:hypothetical protein CROQUDRAFT_38135, partial [Cronartium quercuum f. sp. fusiforme G11]
TAALFNMINCVEGSSLDDHYGVVIAGHIAVYAQGPARPVSGAGAVAMLIGPNSTYGTHMVNSWEFYKPELTAKFPQVDGPLMLIASLSAFDNIYDQFHEKRAKNLD